MVRIKCRQLVVSIAFACLASALATAQEVLVRIDAEGRLERIDAGLERMLGLFPEYPSFQEARVFRVSDSIYALEILYRIEPDLLKQRTLLSAVALDSLRRNVSDAVARVNTAGAGFVEFDQSGRATLLTGTTILSGGYYGTALMLAFDLDDDRAITATYMLSAAAGFFVPYVLTDDISVRRADASLALYGGALGAVHGTLFNLLINGEEAESEGTFGLSVPVSIAELVGGFMLSDHYRLSEGKVGVISGVGTLGLGFGAGAAYLTDQFEAGKERGTAAMMLVGSGLGLLAGNTLANMQPYSAGDAQTLNTAAALGGYVPLAIVDLAGGEDDGKPYVGAAMVGAVAGVAAGHFLVKDKEFSRSQGTYVSLSTLAGGLLGFGVAYLASSDGDNSSLYLTSSALGGVGGFALMYGILSNSARGAQEEGRNWRIDFSPSGLYGLIDGSFRDSRHGLPLVGVHYRY